MPTSTTSTPKTLTRQTYSGVVVSDKMKDTCVVSVERFAKHAKYHK